MVGLGPVMALKGCAKTIRGRSVRGVFGGEMGVWWRGLAHPIRHVIIPMHYK